MSLAPIEPKPHVSLTQQTTLDYLIREECTSACLAHHEQSWDHAMQSSLLRREADQRSAGLQELLRLAVRKHYLCHHRIDEVAGRRQLFGEISERVKHACLRVDVAARRDVRELYAAEAERRLPRGAQAAHLLLNHAPSRPVEKEKSPIVLAFSVLRQLRLAEPHRGDLGFWRGGKYLARPYVLSLGRKMLPPP